MFWSSLYRLCAAAALPCALLVGASGCGGSGGPDGLVPVSGKVTVGGKALTTGSVSFRADKLRGNNSKAEPYGEIKPDGTYKLFTEKREGAPPGKYVVMIVANDPTPLKGSELPKSLIDRKYADPENPVIQVDIVDRPKADQYDLKLN